MGVIDALRAEIAEIDGELAGYRKGAPLTDELFWSTIVPIFAREDVGLTSAEVQDKLNAYGISTNSVALRTFLSRNKSKGRLVILNQYSPPKWRISDELSSDPLASSDGDDEPTGRVGKK